MPFAAQHPIPATVPDSDWMPDVLPGFEQAVLPGLSDAQGPIEAVLVRKLCVPPRGAGPVRAVLHIHGYVDYFFQTHLADFYNQAGLHFYAIDLRRHGRALRPGQVPNFTRDLDAYLQDVDAAITRLCSAEKVDWLVLNGHSTGGLVACLYAHRGAQRAAVQGVCLNSPFLDMNLPQWQQTWVEPVLAALGAIWPRMRLPGLARFYGKSLHAEHAGAWRYNTDWKPVLGFPVYAGWFRAIHRAQAEVARGLAIACPVLLLHAARSSNPVTWSEDVLSTDIVLNVADMRRLAPKLGPQVEVVAIEGGIHDLVLSRPAAREQVFGAMRAWLGRLGAGSRT